MFDLFTSPSLFVIRALVMIVSLTLHEYAHAWSADRLGDPTPRLQGRLSFNPMRHLDPIGTLAMLLFHFGWGKPVQIDPYNLKNPVKDTAMIALAGPVVNVVLACVCAVLLQLFALPGWLAFILSFMVLINIVFAVFNLVPIAPLDGSKILPAILPHSQALAYEQFMHRYGFMVLIAMLLPWGNGVSPISTLITPIIQLGVGFLLP